MIDMHHHARVGVTNNPSFLRKQEPSDFQTLALKSKGTGFLLAQG